MVRKMINMARSVEQMQEVASPTPLNVPCYSYGLSLCFDQETLDKLNLDNEDVEVGDMLHLFAMAEVTSVSKQDTGRGEQCRVELTLTHIGLENENQEEYEAE